MSYSATQRLQELHELFNIIVEKLSVIIQKRPPL
ncbi:hypothetical protein CCP3SC15_220027 [Gammaproteobacteria bacterium]